MAQANSVISRPVSLWWEDWLLLGLGPQVLGTVSAWVSSPWGLQLLPWEAGLSTLLQGFPLHTRGLITSMAWWCGSDMGVFRYSPQLLILPLSKVSHLHVVRSQFCYSQDAYVSICPQYLQLLFSHHVHSFLCSRLWDGGKIMSLDCIYTKYTLNLIALTKSLQ